jgi:hypothetical protein
LSSEQQTQVTDVFRNVNVRPIPDDVDVTIGATLPASVTTLHTCPIDVGRIIRGLPGCRYVAVGSRIVLVDPGTRRVVAVVARP